MRSTANKSGIKCNLLIWVSKIQHLTFCLCLKKYLGFLGFATIRVPILLPHSVWKIEAKTCLFSWMCSVLFIFQSSFNAAVNTKWTDFYLLRFEFTIVVMKKLHPITLLQINRTDFHDWDSWEMIIRFWKKEKKNSFKISAWF